VQLDATGSCGHRTIAARGNCLLTTQD